MIILGIDTSCDDTAVAQLEVKNSKFKILSNVVSSQVKIHAKYGGVYPFLAKREHQKNLPIVFKKALLKTGISQIDFIAVAQGPGLEPCLWQGINFAKDLSEKYKKPLIPINHIEAHIIASFIGGNSKLKIRDSKLFPAVCLVVSGGHTQVVLVKNIGSYKVIGETRDDAAGECLDKAARILGLGYPGGPAIAACAAKFKAYRGPTPVSLPRPMFKQKNYDFSFSGLKTAVLYKVKELKTINYELKTALCAEVQQAVIDVLIHKTLKAARDFKVKSIIIGGGVAANSELRKQFKSAISNQQSAVSFFAPPEELCTDNAVMAAAAAYFHRTEKDKDIKADANLRIYGPPIISKN